MPDKTAEMLPFKTDEGYTLGDCIMCPICDFNYNHVRAMETIPGNDNYEAGWTGRGDLIVIQMECESGHKWELCIGFHKGQNFIFARKAKRRKKAKVE